MLSRFEELKLIARCVAADDRDAFGRLVTEYEGGLRRFLFNLTGNDAALTDDLSQDTFLRAYLSIRSFKGISKFKTWLYRIAYNEFIDWKRRNREVSADEVVIPELSAETGAASDAKIDLEHCMASLNDTEKSIVLLFYIEDMPIKKVADILGCPEGTVKSYLSRARVKMADVMNR
ncbi:MAG: RNA polymerase sigma factor [Muribaculaceae bacterium]|nr:RNA polymerase sigma factor [Muribaculaceae bacterium]MDE7155298.1 RNA polymerase sigma factor [Muribaculaceae bacterium]MDE7369139.1 RNA polymerase sigma factor [Muribaculaceae bacterium]